MKRSILTLAALTLAGCGTDVSGPGASMFACAFGEHRALAVGEVAGFQGPGNRAICLTTGDSAAVFAYIPFFASPGAGGGASETALGVGVTGGGIMNTAQVALALGTGAPGIPGVPFLGPVSDPVLRLGHDLHPLIRERERAELMPRIRPRPSDGPADRPSVPPTRLSGDVTAAPAPGDTMAINVALSCSAEDIRTGRVMRVSNHAILVADIQNPTGFTSQDYQAFAAAFDTLVYPVATRHFGEPSDIGGHGRTIVFFTRAVNQLNQASTSTFTAALFWAGDLFPATATDRLEACPAGNRTEMFYMAVPDPHGSAGVEVSAQWLRDRAVHIMAHEYQHLLNAARRLHVNQAPTFERTWLNEGLSHIAEELIFFQATGLPRRANITMELMEATPGTLPLYDRYMSTNHHNMARYLRDAPAESLMGPDGFATRGAAWSFLRYAADRTGAGDEAVFRALLDSRAAGVENLDQVLDGSSLEWMRDWAVSLFADDYVPGLDPVYTQPSWNLRDIHRVPGGGYRLTPVPLTAGDVRTMQLRPGGAAHLLFGIEANGMAAIHVEAGGQTPPGALRGVFLRVR